MSIARYKCVVVEVEFFSFGGVAGDGEVGGERVDERKECWIESCEY